MAGRFSILAAIFVLAGSTGFGQNSVKTSKFGESAYAFIPSGPIGWNEAKEQCEKMGGHLATIASAAESDFVQSLAPEKRAWLGGKLTGAQWAWVDGSPWEFENFAPILSEQHHLMKRAEGKWGIATDTPPPINAAAGFLCEWPADRAPGEIAMRDAPDEPAKTGEPVTFFGVTLDGVATTPPKPGSRPRPGTPAVKRDDFSQHFVSIESGDGEGRASGVLAKLGGEVVILTNAHAVSGMGAINVKLASGAALPVGKFSVSGDRNLAVLKPANPQSVPPGAGFEIFAKEAAPLAYDSPILILEEGIELDAKIDSVETNRFLTKKTLTTDRLSAVLDPKSKQLVGLAAGGRDLAGIGASAAGGAETIVRLDSDVNLQELSLTRWVKEREALDGLAANTRSQQLLVKQLGGDHIIFVNDFQGDDNPLAGPIEDFTKALGKAGSSKADQLRVRESFLRQAAIATQRDLSGFQASHFSGAHHTALFQAEIRERDRLKREIEAVAANPNVVEILDVRYRAERDGADGTPSNPGTTVIIK